MSPVITIADKAWSLFPDAFMCHYTVAQLIHEAFPKSKTVIDMGGVGRLKLFIERKITDANIKKGLNGEKLPFHDNKFDVTVSINTLEHVKNKKAFVKEAYRVSKMGCIFCFPFDGIMAKVEEYKRSIGHKHKIEQYFPGIGMVQDWLGNYATHIKYCMPSSLHLAFICGKNRMTSEVKKYLNKRLITTGIWFCKREDACNTIFVIKKKSE